MNYALTSEEIRSLLETSADARAVLAKAKENFAKLKTHFHDSPTRLSGWGHSYCCPKCTAQFPFDLFTDHQPGEPFICTHCGEATNGVDYDEAWTYYYRLGYAGAMLDCTLLALSGDTEAEAFLYSYVDFYADHYEEFPLHGHWAGQGKIFAQSLDEAVFLLTVLRALWPILDRIPEAKKKAWYQRLMLPLANALLDQTFFHQIHNISLWMRCAVGGAALFGEDPALLARALDEPFGIRDQISQGFTEDGLWIECSFSYHYYCLDAMTEFLALYATSPLCDPMDPLFETLRKGFELPLSFSYNGTSLPVLSDGWYPSSLSDNLLIKAARLLPGSDVTRQLERARRERPLELRNTAALLFATGLPEAKTEAPAFEPLSLYEDSRLAVLHLDTPVIFRAGVRVKNHMHDDYLSVILPPYSDDLGTSGYAHPLYGRYYRRSFSHNTVTADGHSQPSNVRESSLCALPDGVRGEVTSLWDGISATRELHVKKGTILDTFTLLSEEEHTYDWFFHAFGTLTVTDACGFEVVGEQASIEGDNYDLLTDVRYLGDAFGKVLRWETDFGTLTMTLMTPADLFRLQSPSNPADEKRQAVLLRRKASSAAFTVAYTLKRR